MILQNFLKFGKQEKIRCDIIIQMLLEKRLTKIKKQHRIN